MNVLPPRVCVSSRKSPGPESFVRHTQCIGALRDALARIQSFVERGVNGEVVPIRDAAATAEAVLKCWERVRQGERLELADLREKLSFETFAREFIAQLKALGIV